MTYDDAERLAAMTAVRLCHIDSGSGARVVDSELVIDLQPGMILDDLRPGENITTIDPDPRGWHCDCCGGPNPSGNLGCVWCGGGTPP